MLLTAMAQDGSREEALGVVPPADWDVACSHCHSDLRGTRGNWCSGCRLARYCNRTCQREAWASHKVHCEEMGRLRKTVYWREFAAPPRRAVGDPFPGDTPGVLEFRFAAQGGGSWLDGRFGFTRRSATEDNVRLFRGAGMELWRRGDIEARLASGPAGEASLAGLSAAWTLIHGEVGRSGLHASMSGDHLVVVPRSLSIDLTRPQFKSLCLALAAMKLGLITGHRLDGSRGPVTWMLHNWNEDILSKAHMPRERLRDIVYFGAVPLLPETARLAEGFVRIQELARSFREEDREEREADASPARD